MPSKWIKRKMRLSLDYMRLIQGKFGITADNFDIVSNCITFFSLIANISQLENQLSEAELKFHRETNDLRTKIRQLEEQNEQLERKANGLLM